MRLTKNKIWNTQREVRAEFKKKNGGPNTASAMLRDQFLKCGLEIDQSIGDSLQILDVLAFWLHL